MLTLLLSNVWINILNQYTRGKSHSSVPFVMLALLNVGTWKNILKVYMRDRNSSVSFAMLAFLQIITWKDIMKQYIRDHMANLSKSEDLVTNKLLRLLRIFMRQTLLMIHFLNLSLYDLLVFINWIISGRILAALTTTMKQFAMNRIF